MYMYIPAQHAPMYPKLIIQLGVLDLAAALLSTLQLHPLVSSIIIEAMTIIPMF